MPQKILINYRREDSSAWAGRVFDRMSRDFGPANVFIDIDGIKPGVDFVKALDAEVAKCDICLAMVGKQWLEARDTEGKRRLDNPQDFVRAEIESSLKQGKTVIPVLVDGATMPSADALPDDLKPFATRQAITLTHIAFREDSAGLVNQIRRSRAGDLSPHGFNLLIAALYAMFAPVLGRFIGESGFSRLLNFNDASTDFAEGTTGSLVASAIIALCGFGLMRRRSAISEQERTLFYVGFALLGAVVLTQILWVLVSTFGNVGPAHRAHLIDYAVSWLFVVVAVRLIFSRRGAELSDIEWLATVAAVGVVAFRELSFVYTIFIAGQWLPDWAPTDSDPFQIAMAVLMAAITAGLALWTRRSAAAH